MVDRLSSPYEQWAAKEGIPIIRGYAVEDIYEIPLEPWPRKGGKGAFIHLEGGEGFGSAYICEIPPKTTLKPQRHLFEERIYVLQGKGETKVWNEGCPVQTIAWHEYSLFSPPLNVWHQHTNTGDEPAKYIAITSAPLIFNIYRNPDFIFNDNFIFKDRYSGEADYFKGTRELVARRNLNSGFISDVRDIHPTITPEYGKGFSPMALSFSGNSTTGHIATIDPGYYKKPHRHQGGTYIIIVQGTGYALIWKDWEKRVRVDFKKGSIYSPPEALWHTHFNTGTEEVRQIASYCLIPGTGQTYQSGLAIKKGGDLMEREDEPPELGHLFEKEMVQKGRKSLMSH